MKTTILSFSFVLIFTASSLAQVLSSSSGDVSIISGPGISRIPAGYAVQFDVRQQYGGFDALSKELKSYLAGSTQLYARQEAGEYKYRLGNFATETEAVLLKKQLRSKTRYKDSWVTYDAGGMPVLPVDPGQSTASGLASYEYVAAKSPTAVSGPKAYAIQLGAYEVKPGASDFQSISNLGVIYSVKEGNLFKARLGAYESKEAAGKVIAKVHKSYPKAYIIVDPNAVPLLNQKSLATPVAYEKAGSTGAYTVKKGDTLFSISQKTGVPVFRLREINQLAPDAPIRVGQVIRLQ
ncbi:MAG TPA: SPOR domain-containing protein [Saprospiraceae bacterium]|nr:SPOR domain-containing protein [Saprospiraceae bacterium]